MCITDHIAYTMISVIRVVVLFTISSLVITKVFVFPLRIPYFLYNAARLSFFLSFLDINCLNWSQWWRLLMQVSKYGSVQVENLMNVERYSHVMHISSTVRSLSLMTFWHVKYSSFQIACYTMLGRKLIMFSYAGYWEVAWFSHLLGCPACRIACWNCQWGTKGCHLFLILPFLSFYFSMQILF